MGVMDGDNAMEISNEETKKISTGQIQDDEGKFWNDDGCNLSSMINL